MKKYIVLLIFTIIIGALPLFIQYGNYIFYTDFGAQLYPFIVETKRMFSAGMPLWSWNTYMGDNFIGDYSYYTITSPFVWLNCLFPYEYLNWGIFFTLILKYICAFFSSRLYLRRIGISPDNSSLGGLMYAFSSYTVTNSYYYIFFEPLIVFPILLWAIERFLSQEHYSCTILAVSSFVTFFINYYMSIASLMVAVIYVLVRLCFLGNDKNKKIRQFLSGASCVMLGCLLASFILFPTAYQLSGSPRNEHIFGLDLSFFGYALERLRVLVMPQIMEQATSLFRGADRWNSNSVCVPIVGMFFALLCIIRNRKSWISILLAILLIIYLTPINGIFNMYTAPNYTRWAYALALFIVVASMKYLDTANSESIKKPFIVYTLSVILVMVASILFGLGTPTRIAESKTILLAFYLFLLFAQLLFLYGYVCLLDRRLILIGIILCTCIQMCMFHTIRSDLYFHYVKDDIRAGVITKYVTNNQLSRQEGDFQYRTAFNGRFQNLALLKNRPSVSSFHSIINNKTRLLLPSASLVNNTDSRFSPTCNFESFYSLMSVKEYIQYNDLDVKNQIRDSLLILVDEDELISIYEYRNYIPMGFSYDSYIVSNKIDSLLNLSSNSDIPLQLLANISIKKEDEAFLSKYLTNGDLYKSCNLDSLVYARKKKCSSNFIGTSSGFVSEVSMEEEGVVFYSVPADEGFTAYVDGKATDIFEVNMGQCAVVIPQGKHTVKFRFVPRGIKKGLIVSVLALILIVFLFIFEKYKRNPTLILKSM